MEEDIKLLEEMKANCIKGMMKGAIYTDEKAERKALAIENLIKGYRELEQKNRHRIIGRIDAIKIEDLEEVLSPYYIPKSKIQEKIKECKNAGVTKTLNNENEVIEEHYFLQDEIDILQEVLEDK